MFKKQKDAVQTELWIRPEELVQGASHPFYAVLDELLNKYQFDQKIRALFLPYYEASGPGRPGVDPAVYVKMILIGFFERIPSEREIELRCSDSIMLREFLGFSLTERVPDHTTLSVIRRRIPVEVYTKVFTSLHPVLEEMGLLRGKHVGMDTSAMHANASMRGLTNRMTEEKYRAYITRLAKKEGIDTKDPAAINRFDRKRKDRKTSNKEWENPHDPDAKIGRSKHGNTRMIYKPEHTVDMETGALIDAQILFGDVADNTDVAGRLCDAEKRACDGLEKDALPIKTVTADCGYSSVEEMMRLTNAGIEPNIPDKTPNRNMSKLSDEARKVVEGVRKRVKSREGKKLLRKRGMYIERSFAHILDDGALRRTTLRGRENIQKRYMIAALGYNLSLVLFTLFGTGRPKSWAAKGVSDAFSLLYRRFKAVLELIWRQTHDFYLYGGGIVLRHNTLLLATD